MEDFRKAIPNVDVTDIEHDASLPACPVCNAAALQLSTAARRQLAETKRWAAWLLEHDCDCDLEHEMEYRAGVELFVRRETNRQVFLEDLPQRYQSAIDLDAGRSAASSRMQSLKTGAFAYLWGPGGTGKTTLAIQAAHRLTDQVPAKLVTVSEHLESVRKSFSGGREAADLTKHGVLVLDDLGKEKPSAWVAERLFAIVEHFWSNQKSLIVTSQYPPNVAAERIYTEHGHTDAAAAGALMSRLGSGLVLHVTGQDHRLSHLQGRRLPYKD